MIQMEKKEIPISKELKSRIEKICKFCKDNYTLTNGNVINFKGTNIAYAKPHILKVKGNNYLIFEESDFIYVNGYRKKIKFNELEKYIRL